MYNSEVPVVETDEISLEALVRRNIGIWGAKGAGKTTFLTLLYHAFRDQGWRVKAADQDSDEFRLRNYRLLFERGQFPPQTRLQDIVQYHLDVSRVGAMGVAQAYRLVFTDASGDWYEDPARARTYVHERDPDPFDWLKSCDSLLLLVDPAAVVENRSRHYVMISRALAELQRAANPRSMNRPIRTRLSVCFTKMDRHTQPDQLELNGQRMQAYARVTLGDDILQEIDNACEPQRVRFFRCSAIGWARNDDGGFVGNTTREPAAIRDLQQRQPRGLIEPLLWMLD